MGHGKSLFFKEIAQKYSGFYRGKNLFRQPAAFFPYRDTRCRVRLVKRFLSSSRFTEVAIHWSADITVLELVANGAVFTLDDRRLERLVQGPDSSMPAQVVINANPVGVASRLLTQAVQWRISQLAALSPVVPLGITLARGQLTVRRTGFPANFALLDDFVRLSLELHDQFRLAVAEGVTFRESVAAAIDDTRCPVCCSDLDGPIVICARCRTPHCRDCWIYNGKCGMYACNETRFVARDQ